MKKVMHLVHTGNYSGAENVALNISLLLDNQEHIYVSPSGTINPILMNKCVTHYPLEQFKFSTIDQAIAAIKPDIIHAHDVTASIMAALLSFKYKNIRVVSHLHNNDPKMKQISLRWLSYSLFLPCYDEVLVVSQSVIDEYYLNLLKNKTVLNNVVNITESFKTTSLKYDLITVARLEEQKDPFKFLEVVHALKLKLPLLKVAYIGDGQLKDKFLQEITNLELETTVDYLGFVENPYPIMNDSKVFALTSKYEGFGLVALEAMILGLPAVVSKVGGLPTIVTDEVGLSSNEIGEMVTEIECLLCNPTYYAQKREHALHRSHLINDIAGFKQKLATVYQA